MSDEDRQCECECGCEAKAMEVFVMAICHACSINVHSSDPEQDSFQSLPRFPQAADATESEGE